MLKTIGKEKEFAGVVDLVHMKAYKFDKYGKATSVDVPSDMADEVEEARSNLIEYAAESNDDLLEKFLEGEELSADEIVAGLKQGIVDGGFIPVTCTSAINLSGVSTLLDFIVQLMASPEDRGEIEAGDATCTPDPDAPFAGLVFKTLTDPYAGQLSILRVYSGTISSDSTVYNSTRDENEKFGQLLLLRGKEQKSVPSAGPGEIVAIAKLKHTKTGDTLCTKDNPVRFDFVETPSPVLTYALKPRSRGDEEKIANALARLQEEDSTISVTRDENTHEMLLSGQ
jgi:elongation factor G